MWWDTQCPKQASSYKQVPSSKLVIFVCSVLYMENSLICGCKGILPSLIIGPFLQLIFYLTRYKTACTQESGLTHAIIINVAVSMLCAVHDISFLLLCGTLYFSASWLNQKPLGSSCNLVPRPYSQLFVVACCIRWKAMGAWRRGYSCCVLCTKLHVSRFSVSVGTIHGIA